MLSSRPKVTIPTVTLGVIVLAGVLRGANLWRLRDQAIAAGQDRANSLALLLSEYVRESFAAGDAVLQQLAINSRRIGGPGASDAEWTPMLASSRAGLAGVGAITVTDDKGTIVHSLQPLIVGQSRRDQYLFRQLATSARDELVVDTPFLSVVEPRVYLIPIGRRLTSADGRFVGAVVATYTPDALRGMLRSADVGRNGQVALIHPSGMVMVREPDRDVSGRRIARTRAPAGLPLSVSVSVDRDEILRDWRLEAMGSAIFFGLLFPGACLALWLVFRQMDAKQRIEAELRRVEEREAIELREAHARLEEALAREQRARREVEAASYMKDEFLMTVSHELRTPLTSISGWAELLARGMLKDDQRPSAIEAILRSAQTQSRLVEDLLDMSRIITGGLRLDIEPVDVGDLICAAIDSVHPAARAKNIQIDIALDPAAQRVPGDHARLQQVVWNLLANAIKFTPEGGRIEVRLDWHRADVEVIVRDSGIGITPEFLPHVFERFRQADAGSLRRYSGLGLGLAIARHLVELHGGAITVESEGEGRGATFRVRLPITPLAPNEQPPTRVRSAQSA